MIRDITSPAGRTHAAYLSYQLGSYTGPRQEEIPEICTAYCAATGEDLDTFKNGTIGLSEVQTLWEAHLTSVNRFKIYGFGRKSQAAIKNEGKERLERAEQRLIIYFGKLLLQNADEADLILFVSNMVKLERSVEDEAQIISFAEGFLNCSENNQDTDRYNNLSEYCYQFMENIFNRRVDNGSPYQPPANISRGHSFI